MLPCASLEEGMPPEAYIVILPDWDGSAAALGLRNTPGAAGVVLLDGEGNLLKVFQGADLAETTLSPLSKQPD